MGEKIIEEKEKYASKPEVSHETKHEEDLKLNTEINNHDIHKIRKNIKELSLSKENYQHSPEKQSEETEKPKIHYHYLTKKIKLERYKIMLEHVRKNLPKRQQIFSNFIHQSTLEAMSEIGSKTIARPSGILGGCFIALIASPIILFIAHKIGFEVPNSLIIILFIAGFIIGCLAEFTVSSLKKLLNKR